MTSLLSRTQALEQDVSDKRRARGKGTAEAVEEDVALLVGNKVRFGSRGSRDPLMIESRPPSRRSRPP